MSTVSFVIPPRFERVAEELLLRSAGISKDELCTCSTDIDDIVLTEHDLAKWIFWFLSSKGNEYFCEVEEDFILDRFNLTGLNNEVANYAQALDLITDNLDDEIQDELRGSLDVQARLLYGLIHARWIVTARGLAKMLEKYKRADFGRCPRVLCQSQPLLPVGLTDIPYQKAVKLYCGRCEDIYSPKSSRHGSIDGAYFGTSFPHLLFLVYPTLIPPKSGAVEVGTAARGSNDTEGNKRSRRVRDEQEIYTEGMGEGFSTASVALKADRYRPRIFGFQIHEIAKLQRWQEAVRDRQVTRLEHLEEANNEV
ncbi:casein kinase 2 regulatory subunit [Steccherinum ochraceum]|uniref:Casein kinase II subunit beta n=1 Tax=Steccherinum ochraceum TaxID=92696 RepID=A0A4R0R889_9APHY|nr:casein kinase 2 regulatory subunit [Steccherinum ochraceum]